MHIAKNSIASIRYIMKDSKGVVLENIMGSNPVNYLHGSTGILNSLQAQLDGLKAGDTKTVYLKAESDFTNEDFIFEVIVDDVRAAMDEEILLGYPVKINIQKCETDCYCYSQPMIL